MTHKASQINHISTIKYQYKAYGDNP